MNYRPNLVKWKVGDIVVHDMDAKEPYMLMVVTKVQKNGLYITRLISKDEHISFNDFRTNWKNERKYLLDPKRFNISISEKIRRESKNQYVV